MKTKFYLLFLPAFIFLSACEYVDFNPEDTQLSSEEEFTEWVNKLDPELAESYFNNFTKSFMRDARSQDTDPFSIKDVVTWQSNEQAPNDDYHGTYNAGTTSVYYGSDRIFHNTWNKAFMRDFNVMTMLDFGKINNSKVLYLVNNSWFPPDDTHDEAYFANERRLFAEVNGKLQEYDLKEMGVTYVVLEKRSTTKEDVMLFEGVSHARTYPGYRYFTFIHLPSKKFRTIAF